MSVIIPEISVSEKCINCQLLGRDTMYCTIYPRRDLDVITATTGKPKWCPLKSVDGIIERLKALKADCEDFYEMDRTDVIDIMIRFIKEYCEINE